jgi:V-type H+-transporting ATPase subunit a
MGLFSMYVGLIYNDIFSQSLHLWPSGWTFPPQTNETVTAVSNGRVYPFGIDPAWHGSENILIFTNSYKMKMSVILGVLHVRTSFLSAKCHPSKTSLQMTFALCLQLPNHIHFKRPLEIWANFVPQMIFLQSIFGYLVICIIYKWTIDWSKSPTQPPSLLNMLILMFLSPGTVDPRTQLYPGQAVVQVVLLLLAAVCVPWLLCVKPYVEWKELKMHEQGYVGLSDGILRESSDGVLEREEEGDGRAIIESADEEHVRTSLILAVHSLM